MKHKTRKFTSLALALALALALVPGMTLTANADGDTSSYTLTIPSTLPVANSGWNATSGISATGTLESGKKLTVTATSDGEFALVNQSDNSQKVGYKLATASTDTEATTSWEFETLSSTATTKPMGIIVEDYSTKTAGTYTDTVTFTASVESAAYVPKTFTSLSDGDVLRVGDTLEVASGEYIFPDDGCSLMAWNAPFTVLRANVEGINDPSRRPTVTEDANGTYYVIKGNENNYFDFSGKLVATDTSDDVKITKNGDYWAIAVNEP